MNQDNPFVLAIHLDQIAETLILRQKALDFEISELKVLKRYLSKMIK